MAMATFDDHATYHPALIGAVLAAERDPRFRDTIFKGGCGIKVRDIPGWHAPAAALIHARALLLAHHTLSRRAVYADATWASVYHAGDYCMPRPSSMKDMGTPEFKAKMAKVPGIADLELSEKPPNPALSPSHMPSEPPVPAMARAASALICRP